MDLQQCYTTLDLPFGASFEEVKRAYKELVRVWHPDRFPNSPDLQQRAHSKLSRINEAYETLKAHFESGGHNRKRPTRRRTPTAPMPTSRTGTTSAVTSATIRGCEASAGQKSAVGPQWSRLLPTA